MLRTVLIECGILALIAVGLGLGYKFIRRGNNLLGFEWIILGFSASNMFLYFNGVSELAGHVAYICDAFSRWIGFPVIALLGLMKATHGKEPPLSIEIALFVGGFLASVLFVDTPSLQSILPLAYYLLGLAWAAFLFYFAYRCWRRGLVGHAGALVVANVAVNIVALMEGVITLPEDSSNLLLDFLVMSHWVWAIVFAEIYFAYVAFTNAVERERTGSYAAG
jgi:fucose 4-O-acetylase-like acetyltransferase